jgi:uncharacterized protein (TIGR02466 family)
MKIEHLFPTIILEDKIPEEKFNFFKKIIELKFNDINSFLVSNTWEDNVITTYEKCTCIISTLNLQDIQNYIDPLVLEFKKAYNITSDILQLKQSWINITPPKGFQDLHIHNFAVPRTISGVLYLDIPENSGEIQFHPSLSYEQDYKGTYNYKPESGLILIFHGHQPHRVLFNKSNKNRISLSFNYFY